MMEGEIEGMCFPGRRRTAWIDDVRRRTIGALYGHGELRLI